MYPETVIASINAKVTANQTTLQRTQEVLQREAEANMARAQADGAADVKRKEAQEEADAIAKVGEALNRYPQMKDLRSIEKWNGALPTYMTQGSVTPFVSFK